MAVIAEKIALAQKQYDEGLKQLKSTFKADVCALESKLIVDEEALLETHVNSILNKII